MKRYRWIVAGGVLLLLVGASFFWASCYVSLPKIAPVRIEKPKLYSHTGDFLDPLPPGAIARIGTTELRSTGSIAVSLDGKLMVSNFGERPIHSAYVWETKSGKKRLDIDCEDPFVALSPKGTLLATCGKQGDMGVRLWDVPTGESLREILIEGEPDQPHQGIRSVIFLSDGKSLAAISWHEVRSGMPDYARFSAVKIVDVETGELLRTFTAPNDNGYVWMHISFSPDGQRMSMVGGKEQTVYLWDVSTGEMLQTLGEGESSTVFSSDGRVLAIAGYKAIRLIELATGKEICSFTDFGRRHGGPGPMALSSDGKLLVVAGGYGDRILRVWNTTTKKLVQQIAMKSSESARDLEFLPDSTTIITAYGGTVRSWDVIAGKEKLLPNVLRRSVFSVVFSPDGKTLALCGNDPGVRLHDATTLKMFRYIEKEAYVRSMAFSPDSTMLVTGGDNLCLWEVPSGKRLQVYHERTTRGTDLKNTSSVDFLPSGKEFVSGNYGGIVQIWSTNNTQPVLKHFRLKEGIRHSDAIYDVAVFPRGDQFAILTNRGLVYIWDRKSDEPIGEFNGNNSTQPNRPLAISPDGQLLAFEVNRRSKENHVPHAVVLQEVGGEKREHLLDKSWERELSLYGVSVAFSPDGKFLATCSSWDSSVRLWDVASTKEIGLFDGHVAGVSCLDFSPDGKILATAGNDGTVLLWDITGIGDVFHAF